MQTTATPSSKTRIGKVTADLCPACGPLKRPYPSHLTVKVYDAPEGTVVLATCNSLACDYFDIRAIVAHVASMPKRKASVGRRFVRSLFKGLKVLVFGI